jgi:hypothetical protein
MSNDVVFQCPVCRANQTLRETCRRCKADLGLVARAYRRVEHLLQKREQAIAHGDHELARALATELQWLAPKR